MFRVHSSNRLEQLANELAEWASSPSNISPLQAQTIIVQSNGMARWLSLAIAKQNGIAANINFPFPASFIWKLYRDVLGDRLPEQSPYNSDRLTWTLLDMLPQLVSEPGFAPIKHYFDATDARSQYDLAARIADIFDQYLVFRPDWVAGWESGSPDAFMSKHWQAKLWRKVHDTLGADHRAALQDELFAQLEASALPSLPSRIAIFGIPTLPPGVLETFRRISGRCEVDIFMLAPCSEYWGDIVEEGEVTLLGDDYLAVGNNLLAATGKQGKEFFNLLLSGGADARWEERSVDPLDTADTLLARLQHDVLVLEQHGRDEKPVAEIASDDASLCIHNCHSPLREMEVLHDQLLALFNDDPTLEPADVCVLSPVLDDYAPYIDAVFGAMPRDDKRYIPFTIADQQRRDSEQLAEAFEQALQLVSGRFGVDAVVDLLSHEAVSRQFELSDDDISQLGIWLADTGVAWGLNAGHREQSGVPPTDIGTWANGLRRLWLGYSMGADCAGDKPALFGSPEVEPYVNIEGQGVELLGRLQRFVDLLEEWSEFTSREKPVVEWVKWMSSGLDKLLAPESTEALVSLRETLAELDDCATSYKASVPLTVVLDAWNARRSSNEGGSGFLAGAVTMASMVPMRSLPFRVLCLVGLNGSVYPRNIRPPEFDLMAQNPRAGDRSRRNDDRYLFLEAILSARETLYLSYVGQSQRDDTAIPPSALVSELLDTVDRGFTVNKEPASKHLLTKHPLQAFSKRYFSGSEPLISYRQTLADALNAPQNKAEPFWQGPLLPEPESMPLELSIGQLLSMAYKPAQRLMRTALDMQLPQEEQSLSDRELLQLDGLQQWKLRTGLLSDDVDETRLKASGKLPSEPVGSILFEAYESSVNAQREKQRMIVDGAELKTVDIVVELEGAVIRGELANVLSTCRVVSSASSISHERKLQFWLEHLLLCASGRKCDGYLLSKENFTEFKSLDAGVASRYLQPWVEAWHALSEGPVLLNVETGFFENKGTGTKLPEQRLAEASSDPWVRQLYGRAPQFDAAAASWAKRLYAPYVENIGKDLGYA